MTSRPTRERLGSLIVELLENAAFVFAETTVEKPWAASDILCARVVLEHGERVELSLCVARELAVVMAANLLALEPDSEQAEASASDTVGELANMVAGSLAVEISAETWCARSVCPRWHRNLASITTVISAVAPAARRCEPRMVTGWTRASRRSRERPVAHHDQGPGG